MADAAAARREARRRRILENSHSRLKLISGKCGDEYLQESSISPYSLDQDSQSLSSSSFDKSLPQNGVLFTESETLQFISALAESSAGGDGEITSELPSLASPTPEPSIKSTTLWEKLIANKYDIVLLSLFIQFLYGISLFSVESNHFFLPLIVYTVTKLILYPVQNNSSIANVLLLLNGMSPDRVQKLLYTTQYFSVIFCDIFIYLFVTICVQSLWITLKNSLVT